ncbi:MAG: hypothetical protein ACREOD_04675 [Candidatus Dormibacteria bacterium]
MTDPAPLPWELARKTLAGGGEAATAEAVECLRPWLEARAAELAPDPQLARLVAQQVVVDLNARPGQLLRPEAELTQWLEVRLTQTAALFGGTLWGEAPERDEISSSIPSALALGAGWRLAGWARRRLPRRAVSIPSAVLGPAATTVALALVAGAMTASFATMPRASTSTPALPTLVAPPVPSPFALAPANPQVTAAPTPPVTPAPTATVTPAPLVPLVTVVSPTPVVPSPPVTNPPSPPLPPTTPPPTPTPTPRCHWDGDGSGGQAGDDDGDDDRCQPHPMPIGHPPPPSPSPTPCPPPPPPPCHAASSPGPGDGSDPDDDSGRGQLGWDGGASTGDGGVPDLPGGGPGQEPANGQGVHHGPEAGAPVLGDAQAGAHRH